MAAPWGASLRVPCSAAAGRPHGRAAAGMSAFVPLTSRHRVLRNVPGELTVSVSAEEGLVVGAAELVSTVAFRKLLRVNALSRSTGLTRLHFLQVELLHQGKERRPCLKRFR